MASLYEKKRSISFAGVGLLAAAIAIAAGGLFAFISVRESTVVLDLKTLCPVEGPDGRTILILDVSDPLTEVQRAALNTLLEDLNNPATSSENMARQGVPGGVRYIEPFNQLVAYSLGDRADGTLEPFLRICNPGNSDQRTFKDNLTTSSRRADARWNNFKNQIQNSFDQQASGTGLPTSPLLETIALVVQREAPSAALRMSGDGIPITLILFSDLIQNSESLSHFSELPSWKVLTRRPGFANLRSNLDGIEVIAFYLQRADYRAVQTKQHFFWWRTIIDGLGGRLKYYEPL